MCANCTSGIPGKTGSCTRQDILDELSESFSLDSVDKATTGLNIDRVNKNGPTADEVINYLKTLNGYGGGSVVNDEWDCTEKALWGIVHARHRFPGLAIGMSEGIAKEFVPNQAHAVIIIWDKGLKSYKYYDPGKGSTVAFDDHPHRILSFPTGPADSVDPLNKMQLSKIGESHCVSMELNYNFYDLKTKDRMGVLDYLNRPIDPKINDIPCCDSNSHPGAKEKDSLDYWRPLDMAFWTYMHVRQIYRGCAIGVAIGIDPKDSKKDTRAFNIIWKKENDELKPVYWNPHPTRKEEVPKDNFIPKTVFF
jgi:hypothetical protein